MGKTLSERSRELLPTTRRLKFTRTYGCWRCCDRRCEERLLRRSAAGAECPDQASFSIAELAFGLVNCNYKIVPFRADEWLCEAGHTAAILGDLVGNRG